MVEIMKCLDCGNVKQFIVPYIDRTMKIFDEYGNEADTYSVGYQSYDDERIVCGIETCGSDNLNIYEEQ